MCVWGGIGTRDSELTLLGLDVGHVQRLGDRREERPERELVDDVREVHHCPKSTSNVKRQSLGFSPH